MAKTKGNVHVAKQPGKSGWNVKQGGEVQSSHRTQATAIDKGTPLAKRDEVDLVVHGRDGKIRSKDSHGNETPKKDTEH